MRRRDFITAIAGAAAAWPLAARAQQSDRVRLNRTAAKALALELSPALLALADEVVE